MNYLVLLAIVAVLIIALLCWRKKKEPSIEHFNRSVTSYLLSDTERFTGESSMVRADDGRKYKVVEGYGKEDEAADILSAVHARNLKLLEYLEAHHPDDPRTKRFRKRYKVRAVKEVDPFNPAGDTSYVVGKGRQFGLCIRQKTKGKEFVDTGDLTFVVLHELAHIISTGVGHGPEFKRNFSWLRKEAHKAGVYSPIINYCKSPRPYCGLMLRDCVGPDGG